MEQIEFTEKELLEIVQLYKVAKKDSSSFESILFLALRNNALQSQAILDYRKLHPGVFQE